MDAKQKRDPVSVGSLVKVFSEGHWFDAKVKEARFPDVWVEFQRGTKLCCEHISLNSHKLVAVGSCVGVFSKTRASWFCAEVTAVGPAHVVVEFKCQEQCYRKTLSLDSEAIFHGDHPPEEADPEWCWTVRCRKCKELYNPAFAWFQYDSSVCRQCEAEFAIAMENTRFEVLQKYL